MTGASPTKGGCTSLQEAPHVATVKEVLEYHETCLESGLPAEVAAERLERFGPNELKHEEGKSLFQLILEQFQDLLVRILLGAAVISFALAVVEGGEGGIAAYVEPLVILIILFLNAAVGVWQESNAEKALVALKQLQPQQARVCRSGAWRCVSASSLVPGDLVDLRCGDKVPADCRVVELKTASFRIEQSQLTGESVAVLKDTEALPASMRDCEIQSQRCLCFSSTTVARGRALAVVVRTGMATQIGIIQAAVHEAGESDDTQSPLQQKLDEFGEALSKVICGVCVVVWLINIGHFSDAVHGSALRGCIYYFKIAVALAVAAIPEGLPAVITTCLALGTRKMAKKNAIVRRLQSVETLGCTTVICSDKTGTLTTNEMTCVRFCVLGKTGTQVDVFTVDGSGFCASGNVCREAGGAKGSQALTEHQAVLGWLCRCAAICNEAHLNIASGFPDSDHYERMGEPTEAALLVLVEKLGLFSDEQIASKANTKRSVAHPTPFCDYWKDQYKDLATLEFSRDRKSMSVLSRNLKTQKNVLFVKGAPETLLTRCETMMLPNGEVVPLTEAARSVILADVAWMAKGALRTLALGVRLDAGPLADYTGEETPQAAARGLLDDQAGYAALEDHLCFIGVVGLFDPPRPEVGNAILQCRDAGIRVVMITGDNKDTAEAVADLVHIREGFDKSFPSYTGKEFEALSASEKMKVLSSPGGAIFSRTEPKHKQLIVKLLKELGETTAMTGDGVNDAPALKQADIGVAMGIAGTEVAKEASDMVLADDNFSTIVSAVEEGRSIYNNMKAFIRYLISSNIGEVASIFMTAALGVPEGLTPVQLLWVNLVTDGPPATALGFNPADDDVMKRPPRHRDDRLISTWIFLRYLLVGIYVGFATVGIFVWWYVFGTDPSEPHTLLTLPQLMAWGRCSSWKNFNAVPVFGMPADEPCSYFTIGKAKASTLSLTVLVVIEMFNAFNALSENHSLLRMPPWANPYLLLATASSLAVHCAILYIPFLSRVFGVVELTLMDWVYVLLWSFPIIILDEILKYLGKVSSEAAVTLHNNALQLLRLARKSELCECARRKRPA
ncbi:calcium-transporting ATPase, putative [Eimeria necatrix]|uniref:P-type Ca(2+) transporter n=1 Tax=Eimeria necatrix TaxID=51315 RepID=U6MV11_9EIME|nr:calcium-transporting ATPase, putative [Eimeria necatrix]CDJ68017.1 calcium-transporting ATPase, putative [Eimeria necatrix]